MVVKLTLHEAMATVLVRQGGAWMDRDVIAEAIAREHLFVRPGDGQPPPSDQLRLRARKYPHIFECSDRACTRIRLRTNGPSPAPGSPLAAAKPQPIPMPTANKYAARREDSAQRYEPALIRLLLVAEAPPKVLDRYFYFEDVGIQDALFRYIARSILGEQPTQARKPELLQRLSDQGVFLIDLKEDPMDTRALTTHVPDLVSRVVALLPESVILIKATVYDAAYRALRQRGLPVIDERIPFPGSGRQRQFEEAMARALRKAALA